MGTLSSLLPLCEGKTSGNGGFPSQRTSKSELYVSLLLECSYTTGPPKLQDIFFITDAPQLPRKGDGWRLLFKICYIDGLVQERRNSIANALELRLCCTKPSICSTFATSALNVTLCYTWLCYPLMTVFNPLRPCGANMRQWSRPTLVQTMACLLAPSHYLNQCGDIVNWTLKNKLRWNLNWNSNIFIQ